MSSNNGYMSGTVDFGFADAKGRALGVVWSLCAVEAVPERGGLGPIVRKADGLSWYQATITLPALPAGFEVRVASARNGNHFGALQRSVWVTDLDAAFAEVARRASGTMRRYAKLGGAS